MNLEYGIYQPLRFYEKLEHQNRFKDRCGSRVFKLIMPLDRLLPFQLKRDAGVIPITSIKYISASSGTAYEVVNNLDNGQIDIFPFDTYDIIAHYGTENHSKNIPKGEYYLEITDTINTWYSEVFWLKDFDPDNLENNNCDITKITYYDTCDIGGIFYRTTEFGVNNPQYKNTFYLEVEVGKPEYEYTEEGDEDGLGRFNPDYKKLSKQYLLQSVFPEFMVDAVQTLPLHKLIEVKTPEGYTGSIDTLVVDSKWQGDNGCWALVDMLFSTDFIIKTGCCSAEDMPINECLRQYTEGVAMIVEGSSNYNNFEYTSADGNDTQIPFENGDRLLVQLDAINSTPKDPAGYPLNAATTDYWADNVAGLVVDGNGDKAAKLFIACSTAATITAVYMKKVSGNAQVLKTLTFSAVSGINEFDLNDSGIVYSGDIWIAIKNSVNAIQYKATGDSFYFADDGQSISTGNFEFCYWLGYSSEDIGFAIKEYDEPNGQYVNPLLIITQGGVVADLNQLNGNYLNPIIFYYKSSGSTLKTKPVITNEQFDAPSSKRLVEGEVWDGCLVKLIGVGGYGEQILGYAEGSDFNQNGLLYDLIPNTTDIYLDCEGLTCSLGESDYYNYPFAIVGQAIVGDNFVA